MQKNIILVVVLVLVIGSIFYLESRKVNPSAGGPVVSVTPMTIAEKEAQFEPAKEITNPSGFINTPESGITVGEQVGKNVVLVDFWTYSCINCQRTLPYLNAWYEKYHDQGLEIIGIHTPEFEFEQEYENVLAAVEKFKIEYPVVLDNDYSTWRAYENRYWPRKYLVDIDGYVVYDHIGEGAYDETEGMIQELLAERSVRLGTDATVPEDMVEPEDVVVVDASKPRTPEIYFGFLRNTSLGNGAVGREGTFTLEIPPTPEKNSLYLGGEWQISSEFASPKSSRASVVLAYQAENIYMVARSETPARLLLEIDGNPIPESFRGEDVSTDGSVTVSDDRLYHLVHDSGGWGEHTLTIEIEGGSPEFYTFTFG